MLSPMFKAPSLVLLLTFLVGVSCLGITNEASREYAVQLSATVQQDPPTIRLRWPQDRCAIPNNFILFRKRLNEPSWGKPTWLSGERLSFEDTNIVRGIGYEYQLIKVTSAYNGYGYIYAGIELPPLLADSHLPRLDHGSVEQ